MNTKTIGEAITNFFEHRSTGEGNHRSSSGGSRRKGPDAGRMAGMEGKLLRDDILQNGFRP